MPIAINMPDGRRIHFPESMTMDQIDIEVGKIHQASPPSVTPEFPVEHTEGIGVPAARPSVRERLASFFKPSKSEVAVSPQAPEIPTGEIGEFAHRLATEPKAPAPAKPSFMQRLAIGPAGTVAEETLKALAAPVQLATEHLAKPLVPFPELFNPETFSKEGTPEERGERVMQAVGQPFPKVLSEPFHAGIELVREKVSPDAAKLIEDAMVMQMSKGAVHGPRRPVGAIASRAYARSKGRLPTSQAEVQKAIREEPGFVEELRKAREEQRTGKAEPTPLKEAEPIEKPLPEAPVAPGETIRAEEAVRAEPSPKEPAIPGVAYQEPSRLTAKEVVTKIEEQQAPEHFDKAKITKQVEKGGETYVKAEVDPNALKVPGEKSVEPGVSAPEKGPIVTDDKGKVIDGRHRTVDAKAAGEGTIEAYVPESATPDISLTKTAAPAIEPRNVAAQRAIGPTERRAQMEQAIADGEARLRTRKNAIGEKLSGREIAATRKAVTQAKQSLAEIETGIEVPLEQVKVVKPSRERIATEDQSLGTFLNNLGGVSIAKSPKEAGELRARRQSKKGALIIKAKNGITLDEAAQRAHESGFIEEPSARAFLEALDSEIEGRPVFSVKGAMRERKIDLETERTLAEGDRIEMERAAEAKIGEIEGRKPLEFEGNKFDEAERVPEGVRLKDDTDITLKNADDILRVEEVRPTEEIERLERSQSDLTNRMLRERDTAALEEEFARNEARLAEMFERTEAGIEGVIAGAEAREVPPRGFVTSIKNATIDRELAEMGLRPATHGERLSFEDARAGAERMVQTDPFAGKKLVDDLVREPRPVTATEDALLLTEQTRLKNERIQAEDQLITAQKSGDQTAIREAKARVEAATADFATIADVVTKVGTESSLSLGHRRMMMKEDYSLAAMERAKQVANDGKPLTEAQRAEVKALHGKITATQKAFDDYVARAEIHQAEIESELAHSRLLAEAKEKPAVEIDPAIRSLVERVVTSMETQADAARIRLREKLHRLHAGLDPTIIADASIIGAAKIARTGLEFTRWSKAMIDDLGEKIGPYLKAVWEASKKRLESNVERIAGRRKEPVARVIKGTDLAEQREAAREQLRAKVESGEDISSQAQTLARLFVEQGIKKRSALIDAVHGELKEVMPDITRRQVMDAISGYGRYRQLSKDQISVELRDLKGQMQQVAKLEDIQSREPPLKTGVERRAPSDEERRLIQQVNEAKRRFGIVVTDPARQLQSALGARKTYYRNQISDLEAQIAAKEKFVKERTVSPTDPELESLKSRRNQLKKEFDEIFGRPGLTDQQRVTMAIRGLAKSIVDLEQRIKTRDIAPRTRAGKTPSTPELEAMRARRDALREQIEELRDAVRPKKTPEQIALQSLKTRLKNQTADMLDRLARGDFTKKPRRTVEMDPEANDLAFENAKVKQQWHEALMKDRLAHRTIPQKIIGGVGEVLNTSRAVLTSLDLSAVLRQGGFTVFAHPIRGAKALPAMFRALLSEKGQHKVNQEILSRENYPLYKRSRLYLAEHGQTLSQMEEAYMARWAEKIPLVGASQRAYVTFLNKLRADSFDAMARTLGRGGEITLEEGNAIANFVNVSTGRGSLGMRENASVGLSTVFFAPRYVASRFQLLAGQPFYRGTARTRGLIAQEYARTLIGLGMVYGLAEMSGAEIEPDPRSSDFGKIKIGNTRIDPLAGLSQTTVLLGRLATGETKTLRRGKVVPIRGEKVPYGGQRAADVMARFLRSKLSPVIGAGVNVLSGENVIGEPVTPESLAGNLLVPLVMQDVYEAMIEQGVPRGTALGLLATFGMGLQTFDERRRRRPDRRSFAQRLEGLGERLVIKSEPMEAVR